MLLAPPTPPAPPTPVVVVPATPPAPVVPLSSAAVLSPAHDRSLPLWCAGNWLPRAVLAVEGAQVPALTSSGNVRSGSPHVHPAGKGMRRIQVIQIQVLQGGVFAPTGNRHRRVDVAPRMSSMGRRSRDESAHRPQVHPRRQVPAGPGPADPLTSLLLEASSGGLFDRLAHLLRRPTRVAPCTRRTSRYRIGNVSDAARRRAAHELQGALTGGFRAPGTSVHALLSLWY